MFALILSILDHSDQITTQYRIYIKFIYMYIHIYGSLFPQVRKAPSADTLLLLRSNMRVQNSDEQSITRIYTAIWITMYLYTK